jgi:hypothetical protein
VGGKIQDSEVLPCNGLEKQTFMAEFERFKVGFQPENSKAPSEDPIFQSQTTGIRIQRIDPPYCP